MFALFFKGNNFMSKQKQNPATRYWLVDVLRGVAIVAMVLYHLTWDLNYFGKVQLNMLSGFWHYFAYSIATTFIFVLGISMTLSYHRTLAKTGETRQFKKFALRGLRIFGWGMLITIATLVVIGDGFVIFGILHVIGASIIIAYPFLQRKWLSLAGGVIFILIGPVVKSLVIHSPWLLWAGVGQYGRYMVDYYPVFPWTGVALIGVFVGHLLYPMGKSRLNLADFSHVPPFSWLIYFGKHSLLIYLLHQPLLFGGLVLFGIGKF